MAEIIGVRHNQNGKIYYFNPNGEKLNRGDRVIIDTANGVTCGEVVMPNREVPDEQIVKPLRPLIRKATADDLKTLEKMKKKEKDALEICRKKIGDHKLDMKLVKVECAFDGTKIIFYFTADGRVDFRELVRDLAGAFRTRIELRQIGVRDESKLLGGLGMCGRPFCCSSFFNEFQPVSIKMAKEQGLSLNPVKISGTCGRLMCCLKYEQDSYEHLLRVTPKKGAIVETKDGKGTVIDNNLLTGMLKIRLDARPDAAPIVCHRHDVKKILRDGQIKIEKAELDALKGIEG